MEEIVATLILVAKLERVNEDAAMQILYQSVKLSSFRSTDFLCAADEDPVIASDERLRRVCCTRVGWQNAISA